MSHHLRVLTHLSDNDLIHGLDHLVDREQVLSAQLLAHLCEVDRRKLYLNYAAPSLFTFCVNRLHMSEDVAYKRMQACRAAQAYPVILTLLAQGQLHLSAINLLAPYLTEDNHQELLAAASHKSKRQVEELIAARFPKPSVPTSLRKLPVPNTPAQKMATPLLPSALVPAIPWVPLQALGCEPSAANRGALDPPPPSQRPPAARSTTERYELSPLAENRYLLKVTLSKSTRDKLLRARDLLAHKMPAADMTAVIDEALTKLCDDLEKRKFGKLTHPKATLPRPQPQPNSTKPPAPAQVPAWAQPSPELAQGTSRQQSLDDPFCTARPIPRPLRRLVAERDAYQCRFIAPDGTR